VNHNANWWSGLAGGFFFAGMVCGPPHLLAAEALGACPPPSDADSGVLLRYEVDLQPDDTTVAALPGVLRKRLAQVGIGGATVEPHGERSILVLVPPGQDARVAKSIVAPPAELTFKFVDPSASTDGPAPPGIEILPASEFDKDAEKEQRYAVKIAAILTGQNLENAYLSFQDGSPVVAFEFDEEGAKRFADATSQHVGERFAIVLNGKVISAPRIMTPIVGGSGVIEGDFTVQSASDIAMLMCAGALPPALRLVEECGVLNGQAE
jgi:preprotein translocase subunit SecD